MREQLGLSGTCPHRTTGASSKHSPSGLQQGGTMRRSPGQAAPLLKGRRLNHGGCVALNSVLPERRHQASGHKQHGDSQMPQERETAESVHSAMNLQPLESETGSGYRIVCKTESVERCPSMGSKAEIRERKSVSQMRSY